MKPAPKTILPRHNKEKIGKNPPPNALIMHNLETSLTTTLNKDSGCSSGSIVESFIKPRASTISDHPVYSLDWPGPSMEVSGPHEEFFNIDFAIWIGGKTFSDGCCRPIRMHKVWRALGLIQNRVKQLSIMGHKEAMRRARLVPVKHVMADIVLALKELEINA